MRSITIHNPAENSFLVVLAFTIVVLFQETAFKFIFGLELASRISNILLLVFLLLYSFNSIVLHRHKRLVWYFYIIPGILVFTGMLINTSISVTQNFRVINQVGLLLCWLLYLVAPELVKNNKLNPVALWRYFHNFLLITVLLGIAEYYLVFAGYPILRKIDTSGGPFLAGYISLLYGGADGTPHYRFYGGFLEPGTLALYLIPGLAYALFHRKYISLIVFSFAMFLTDSLGGFISAAILVPLTVLFAGNRVKIFSLFLTIITAIFISNYFMDYFLISYEQKGPSAEVRQDNISTFITSFPALLTSYPLGLPLAEDTHIMQQNKLFAGFNFAPAKAFYAGGLLSFIGYIFVIIVSVVYSFMSIFAKRLTVEERVVVISLICMIPFAVQRQTIWDSGLFTFLYAPYLIRFLQK